MRCRVRLCRSRERAPRTGRARPRAVVVRGAVAGLPAFLSGSFPRHIVQASSRSLRGVGAGRRLLPLPLRRQTQPQTPSFRSSCLLTALRGALVTLRRGWAERRRSSAFGDCFEGAPTHAFASPFFGVAGDRSGVPSVIDAPERKPAAAGGSKDASASGMAPCAGVLRSFLTSQSASPALAPLAPLHRAMPPAFASAPHRLRPPPRLRRHVALLRRLCSLVVPAGSLDAAPCGGCGMYRSGVRRNKLVNLFGNRAT
jgi:hypothetical protein